MNAWKKRSLALLLTLLTLLACAVVPASAASGVSVAVNGKNVFFNSDLGYPFIDGQNRTMVPFRAVANFMDGVEVDWDGDKKIAYFCKDADYNGAEIDWFSVVVAFPIGTNQAWMYVTTYDYDGNIRDAYNRFVQMDTLSQVYSGRTYAPIRYLAEYLCYDVGWNAGTKTVLLTSPDGDWGAVFGEKERALGDNIVTSEYVARQYAYIVARESYCDRDPYIDYLGQDVTQSGDPCWMFQYQPDQWNTIDILVFRNGTVYFNQNGEGYELWA